MHVSAQGLQQGIQGRARELFSRCVPKGGEHSLREGRIATWTLKGAEANRVEARRPFQDKLAPPGMHTNAMGWAGATMGVRVCVWGGGHYP